MDWMDQEFEKREIMLRSSRAAQLRAEIARSKRILYDIPDSLMRARLREFIAEAEARLAAIEEARTTADGMPQSESLPAYHGNRRRKS